MPEIEYDVSPMVFCFELYIRNLLQNLLKVMNGFKPKSVSYGSHQEREHKTCKYYLKCMSVFFYGL